MTSTSHNLDDAAVTFNTPESEASHLLGVPIAEVKKLRQDLSDGVSWKKMASGRTLWSDLGVARAEALLARGASLVLAGPPLPPSEKKALTVARVRTPRVLHVVEEGQTYDPARPVHLWLPKPAGKWFLKGMKVLGRLRGNGTPAIYDYEGNPDHPLGGRRFPRRVGQW
jgi:hypothetical protein